MPIHWVNIILLVKYSVVPVLGFKSQKNIIKTKQTNGGKKSTVPSHAECNKNHVLVSIDLSLKAQNLNFRKTGPNLSVQVIKARQPGILWQKSIVWKKKTKHFSSAKSRAMDASLWESFPQILPVFLAAFLSFPLRLGKKNWVLLPLKGWCS